jgi:hypothetical protein
MSGDRLRAAFWKSLRAWLLIDAEIRGLRETADDLERIVRDFRRQADEIDAAIKNPQP